MQTDFVKRFWSKVNKTPTCWLWTAAPSQDGYGQFYKDARNTNTRAHRTSWELANGPIPFGLSVLHHCDTPLCVRPDHLYIGTAADNRRDAVERGRTCRGENHPRTKLSDIDIATARWAMLFAGIGTPKLARAFGVRQSSIWRAVINPRRGVIHAN